MLFVITHLENIGNRMEINKFSRREHSNVSVLQHPHPILLELVVWQSFAK